MAKRRNAPVVNNGLYRDLHKQVNQTGRQMKRVREEGYGGLDSAIRSVYKNAASTQRGFAKSLTKFQDRQLDLVTKKLAHSRRADKRVTHATNKQVAALGGGAIMSEDMGRSVTLLRQQGRNNARVGRDSAHAQGMVSNAAAKAMDVVQAGTQEAQANAQTLAAESFSQRTNEDLATISQQHHEISMAKLQHVQQLEMADKQHKLAMKQLRFQERNAEDALKTAANGQLGIAKQQVNVAASVAQELYDRLKDGEDPDAILQDMVKRKLIDAEDMQSGVVSYLVRAAKSNQGKGLDRKDMAREVMFALEQMPLWASLPKKQKEKLRKYVEANLSAIDSYKSKSGGGNAVWDWLQDDTPKGLDLTNLSTSVAPPGGPQVLAQLAQLLQR